MMIIAIEPSEQRLRTVDTWLLALSVLRDGWVAAHTSRLEEIHEGIAEARLAQLAAAAEAGGR